MGLKTVRTQIRTHKGALWATSSLLALLTAAAPALAQVQPQSEAPQTEAAQTEASAETDAAGEATAGQETVTVTGTRIPRPSFEGTIPGAQVGRAEIGNRAFTSTMQILNDVPLIGLGSPSLQLSGQPMRIGVAFVDMFDLGTQRTLTLVNGRRYVSGTPATIFTGDSPGTQVDTSTIPSSLIDRVDVLTVGGASAYGSDAISGVVNYILKTDYEGVELSTVGGITQKGDGETYSFRALAGTNFAEDRGNIALAYEHTRDSSLHATDRSFRAYNPGTVESFLNGNVRNPNYNPNALTGSGNTVFLPAASDGQSSQQYLLQRYSTLYNNTGVIFNLPINNSTNRIPGSTGWVDQNNTAGVLLGKQLIPGSPVACSTVLSAADGFCKYAPTALPSGVSAAQVFARYGITPAAGATTAQLNAQALAVLQSNLPTPREYFAANPGTDINEFIRLTVPQWPSDPATGIATPIQFDAAGNVVPYRVATLDPNTPGTTTLAPGGDGVSDEYSTTLRPEQTRRIANLVGHFKIVEKNDWNVQFFTENLYANVKSKIPVDMYSMANHVNGPFEESRSLVLSVNNPFLDAADRAALAAAGITDSFTLGRSNHDIFGDNPTYGKSDTIRTVLGLRGDFEAIDRKFNWEASFYYGKVESETTQVKGLDVNYSLALDTAVNPATGQIVCAAQLNPAAYLGKVLTGTRTLVVRLPGADGIPTEQEYTPSVTQADIDNCQPLNPFGYNQSPNPEALKRYVGTTSVFRNESKQTGGQLIFGGEIVELPYGPLAFSLSGEYRKEEIDFRTSEDDYSGRSRRNPSVPLAAEGETYEWGGELLIPIFRNSDIWGLHTLEFNPSFRYSKQSASAPTYRSLTGTLVSPEYESDVEKVFSLAGTYKPIQDITFRGNISRSIRQPSLLELFLGTQAGTGTVSSATDVCNNENIDRGTNPTLRRANCLAHVQSLINAGTLVDAAGNLVTDANNFLSTFASISRNRTSVRTGSTDLQAEKAESWTVGVVLEPRFLKGFRASADYIEIELKDQIDSISLGDVLTNCYDSEPNLAGRYCANFGRENTFDLATIYTLGYQNRAVTKLRAYNFSAEYRTPVEDLVSWAFGEGDYGDLSVRANAYHLVRYESSASGNFNDTIRSDGSINFPEWKTQLTARYFNGPFDASITWNHRNDTQFFVSGVPATVEQQYPIIHIPGTHLFHGTIGYELGGDDSAETETPDLEARIANARYRIQLTVNNIFNEQLYGGFGKYISGSGGYDVDTFGRTYLLTLSANF